MLTNYVSRRIIEYIEHCLTYDEAIGGLKAQYVNLANEVFARQLLATRRQKSGETLDEFLQALKSLSKVCNFQNVTEIVYRYEAVRDAFITGLLSNTIHQRLLEINSLDLCTMFTQAGLWMLPKVALNLTTHRTISPLLPPQPCPCPNKCHGPSPPPLKRSQIEFLQQHL